MKLAILLLLSVTAVAQEKPVLPALTNTEKIAIQAVQQQAARALAEINEDVKRNHPGYELDPKTLALVPVPKQATPEAKK